MILMGYIFLFFYFDWRLEERRKSFKKIVKEFNISEFNINDQKVVKKGKLNYK